MPFRPVTWKRKRSCDLFIVDKLVIAFDIKDTLIFI